MRLTYRLWYDTRDLEQAGQYGGCLARTRRTMPSVISSAANRINCPCAGSEFLTRSIRWLTSSTYRTCQVSVLHSCTESAEDPFVCQYQQTRHNGSSCSVIWSARSDCGHQPMYGLTHRVSIGAVLCTPKQWGAEAGLLSGQRVIIRSHSYT